MYCVVIDAHSCMLVMLCGTHVLTPLQYSANECAAALLSHGADHTMTSYAGVTALLWAKWVIPPLALCAALCIICVNNGTEATVTSQCHFHDCCNSCAIHACYILIVVDAVHGHLGLPQNGNDIICALLESKGACFNTRDIEGLSLLHKAVEVDGMFAVWLPVHFVAEVQST